MSAPQYAPPASPKKSAAPLVLLLLGLFVVLPCTGLLGFFVYVGTGPDTGVYTGNALPKRFLETVREVGALEEDEELRYFYSDAMADIRTGFYLVSDRRVVVYSSEVEQPLTTVPYADIATAELIRDESFFVDSTVLLKLRDGTPVSFPVSSDGDGDQRFFDVIRSNVPGLSEH